MIQMSWMFMSIILLQEIRKIETIIIYNWMQSYVPKEDIECEEGVSLVISNYGCNSTTLNLSLGNNGRFNVSGFVIYASNDTSKDIATINLANDLIEGSDVSINGLNVSGKVLFVTGADTNRETTSFSPNFPPQR